MVGRNAFGLEASSALVRRDSLDPFRMCGDVVQGIGQAHPVSGGGPLGQREPWPPFVCGPDRPFLEPTAAVRADIVEVVGDAVRTEGAFVRADARVRRGRWKVAVAEFAVGA